jgi:hypothetical protein
LCWPAVRQTLRQLERLPRQTMLKKKIHSMAKMKGSKPFPPARVPRPEPAE